MAKIKALQGIIYNDRKVDISKVVAPPYDVISPSMQNRFYNRDEHNIIKLILGKERKGDTKNNNKYTRARVFLNKWLSSKFLTRDKNDSVYVYEQDYLHYGQKKTRIGFIALMKIEDPKRSGILPGSGQALRDLLPYHPGVGGGCKRGGSRWNRLLQSGTFIRYLKTGPE